MKKTIYIILLLILIVIEVFLILEVSYTMELNLKIFWVYHLILSGVFYLFNRYIFKEELNYFDVIIILFPAMGFISLFLLTIFPKGESEYIEIEKSADLKSYIKDRKDLEYIDITAELGTLGAYDNILTGTLKEKKRFLMGFNPPDITFKIDVLKKALLDEDIDIIHYAATEISSIDEEFQKKILEKEKKEDYKGLLEVYGEYLKSKLLEGEILEFYQKKVLNLLGEIPEDEMIIERLTLLRDSGELEKCEERLHGYLAKNPTEELVEFAMKFYYERNMYEDVIKIKEKFPELSGNVPFNLKV